MLRIVAATLLFALACSGSDSDQAERLRRFNEAKFGMFIHWGPYSLASVEASWPIMSGKLMNEAEYRALRQRFNPTAFDAKAFVKLAREAGQRYMVFTSKHHDGFCMFDSAYTDYKITRTPYGKDIAAQLAAAAREEGMPLGFYYSPPDMNHPAYRDTSKPASANWQGEPARPEWPLYLDYMEIQLRELLTRYGDVFVVWFDGLSHQGAYDGWRFHRMIHQIQPMALINNRIGLTGDYVTPEQKLPKGIITKSSIVNGANPKDQALSSKLPSPSEFQPWETCMTINKTWAYNKNDTNFKSTTFLLRALIDAASRGGNFLLNVGPTPEGTIQPEFQERLRAMGVWLKVNGEAIYGTTFGPLQELPYGKTTAKGKTVFLFVYEMPKTELDVPLDGVRRVRLLAGGRTVKFTRHGGGVRIPVESVAADPHATVFALDLR